MSDFLSDAMNFVWRFGDNLGSTEYFLAMTAVVVAGLFCLRGFGIKK